MPSVPLPATEYPSFSSPKPATKLRPVPETKRQARGLGQLLVNLGCGSRYHPEWFNIDQWVSDSTVVRHDLSLGIPLPDESAAVTYHSHVFEHFSKNAGRKFLKECFRVLRRGGVMRVAVPDLEKMTRLYLKALEESARGSKAWQNNYEWLMLELYDQTVREYSGGGVSDYFRRPSIPNEEFVLERVGIVGRHLMDALSTEQPGPPNSPSWSKRIKRILKHPTQVKYTIQNLVLRSMLGKRGLEDLQTGRFRRSGELHLWMYDRYSLAEALQSAGFVRPSLCTAFQSSVPGWQDYHLDADADGTIYKPDSLYMEAAKPL